MSLRIHQEGYRIIIISAVILFVFVMLLLKAPVYISLVGYILAGILFAWIISFFRHPVRKIPEIDPKTIYAPADGRIVAIEETIDREFLDGKCIQVSIFMSPLNVHVNRIPVSGKVVYTKYHEGKYLVAWHPKSSTENERFTTVIKTAGGNVLVRQIAGAMARRIISYVSADMDVYQGQELGFIRFGSRVDVLLPTGSQIQVKLEQKVRGNETVIATLP